MKFTKSSNRVSLWICFLLLAAIPVSAETTPTADEIISKVVARDKVLVERRKAFDYDIAITRDKLDSDKKVVSTTKDKMVVVGDRRPGYGTRSASGDPEQEAQKTSHEEPFELLKIIDHYTYTLDGEETVDGVDCYKIGFTPKPDMPYENREEKVLNNVSGHIWASKLDFSLIKNEGSLMQPVSVAWIFATLREMEFHAQWRLRSGPAAISLSRQHSLHAASRARYQRHVELPSGRHRRQRKSALAFPDL